MKNSKKENKMLKITSRPDNYADLITKTWIDPQNIVMIQREDLKVYLRLKETPKDVILIFRDEKEAQKVCDQLLYELKNE